MLVTQIEELDKKRNKIYLDHEFAFVIYKGELFQYNIKEGEELSQNDYNEIRNILLPRRAKLRLMNLLKTKDYTRKQLIDKLIQSCYPNYIIENAIKYMESYNYINDVRYAENYIT